VYASWLLHRGEVLNSSTLECCVQPEVMMRYRIPKRSLVASVLLIVIATSSAVAFCRGKTSSPSCCQGKCGNISMPAGSRSPDNCCKVSTGDQKQPALVPTNTAGTLSELGTYELVPAATLFRVALGQPLFPALERWRWDVHHTQVRRFGSYRIAIEGRFDAGFLTLCYAEPYLIFG